MTTALSLQQRSASGRRAEIGTAAQQILLGLLPLVVTAVVIRDALRAPWLATDFHWSYYPAAHRLLHGLSPYAVSPGDIARGTAFVYPALSAVVFAPSALVGLGLGEHLYVLLCFVLIPATLWLLRVRDWRVYGVTLIWLPAIVGWQDGNVSVPLMFLIALAWRERNRPAVAGLMTAVAISLKPFVWPLIVWLLATRRWRAAVWAFGWAAVLNLLAWRIVGFDQIAVYLHLSAQVTDALWRWGYSVLAVAHHLGLGRSAGYVLLLMVSLAVGVALTYTGFVERRDRAPMVLAIALMLVASPLVWNHYFVLLLLPLALSRPRFGVVWTLPIALWAMPPGARVEAWQVAIVWVVTIVCFAVAVRAAPVRRPAHRRVQPGGEPELAATR